MKEPKLPTIIDDDGNEKPLPWRYEVCPRCDGHATQCRLGPMTASEYHEMCDGDPDFPEDYKSGKYDDVCSTCNGQRVVAEVDREACSAEDLQKWDDHLDWLAESAAERRVEYLMMGGRLEDLY